MAKKETNFFTYKDSKGKETKYALEYDKKRSADLGKLGYKVIRFWNNDIDKNLDGVYKILQKEFKIDVD